MIWWDIIGCRLPVARLSEDVEEDMFSSLHRLKAHCPTLSDYHSTWTSVYEMCFINKIALPSRALVTCLLKMYV